MITTKQITSAGLVVLTALLAGCHKKTTAASELEKVAQSFGKTNDSLKSVASSGNASASGADTAGSQSVNAQMNQAVALYKGGNYVNAVARLQSLQYKAPKTPEQTMSLLSAEAAVMNELNERAARGDAQAQEAIRQYTQRQNARR
jgi:outer membrane protein assembly factor BamD (BamD/ComL family)